ncbi:MAG: lipoprotein [Mycobacteriales bacterium]
MISPPSRSRPFRAVVRQHRTAGLAAAVGVLLAGCGGASHSTATSPGASSTGSALSSPVPVSTAASGAPTQVAAAPVESNVPGDIPDNVAYVPYTNASGRYAFVHPEGWVQSGSGTKVTFTDKLNGISATTETGTSAPTPQSARSADIPALQRSQAAFALESVRPVTLPGGSGVLIVYRRNSEPDPVTGKVFRDEVNRYEVFAHGHRVDLELYGAVGSDNVDPYTKISQSLQLT